MDQTASNGRRARRGRPYRGMTLAVVVAAAVLLALIPTMGSAVTACTPTGFYRDGINMTAALVNPASTLTGEVDATGCNVGVYFDGSVVGSVDRADIHGANYFGILVNGDVANARVDVLRSSIRAIGETPFNGTQHGVAIYYRAFGTGTASGRISGNTVSSYQKGGIVANGAGTTATISDNTVTGLGPVAFIAQNGIQVGYGANASVMRNHVTGNSYTGSNLASSGGILVVGGPGYGGAYTVGTQIVGNTAANNDVGVYLSNLAENGSAPTTATNVKVVNNTISSDAVQNTTGLSSTMGYQAGVSDVGNNDKIVNNDISGIGYTVGASSTASTVPIDAETSFTNRPKVHANSTP